MDNKLQKYGKNILYFIVGEVFVEKFKKRVTKVLFQEGECVI